MGINRRSFLKATGLTVAGLSNGWAVKAAAGEATEKPEAKALAGSSWVMVVDVRACLEEVGCEKCSKACDKAHNVPQIKTERHKIMWIWKEHFENAFPSRDYEHFEKSLLGNDVVVLCNHCEDPPCVRVCPTQATWKRESDGIVMMDMHRCIGCRFCMAACPYGSRSFNWIDPRPHIEKVNGKYPSDFPTRMKGVVEKCNFCAERLAVGQAPSCVEACDKKLLTFGDMDDPNSEVRKLVENNFTIRRKPELGTGPQVFYIV